MQQEFQDDDIRALLSDTAPTDEDHRQTKRAMGRARRMVGQRDTLVFALVRIWSALAKMLAPFFAAAGQQQARTSVRPAASHAAPPIHKD